MASNRAVQLIELLTRDKRALSELKFPMDLDTEGNGNIIRFTINLPNKSTYLASGEYKEAIDPATGRPNPNSPTINRPGSTSLRRRFDKSYKTTTTQIDLFMPAQVRTSYSSDWRQEELGLMGTAIEAGYGISEINDWEGAKDSWDAVKNTLGESLLNTAAGALGIVTQMNFKGARSLITNTMPNPYMEVLFNGVQNRTFSFTFKMTPRNAQEQQAIKQIVDEFKFQRAPELKYSNQSNYWLFPSTFDISFLNRYGENPWLFKISTCALTNVSVDYSPEGPNITHANGAPMSVEMTLDFLELELLDKSAHRQGF